MPLPSEHDHPRSKGASASYYDSSDDSSDCLTPLGPFSATKGESPGDLDSFIDSRKDGEDWFALYNPREPRSLNVSLMFQVNHESEVNCVRFSKDGLWLATGCSAGAKIFDVRTGTLRCTLIDKNRNSAYSVCFSPDGKYLATTLAGSIQVNFSLSSTYGLLTGGLVCWDTDVPSTSPSQIWDISRKCIDYTFRGHQGLVNSLDFSHDGSFVASDSDDKTVRIWNMNTRESKVFPIADDPDNTYMRRVRRVAVSPNDRFVAVAFNKVVYIWDIETRTQIDCLRGHDDWVYSVVFTPDGKGLVSCSYDKTLKYWEFSTALSDTHETGRQFSECMQDFTGHRDQVFSVAISHDGQWIVSGSGDRGVQFWDRHGRTHLMLQGHHEFSTWLCLQVFRWSNVVMICAVTSVDLSPAGGYLATGASDRRTRVCKSLPTCYLPSTLPTELSFLASI